VCVPALRVGLRTRLRADSDLAHLRQRLAASVEAVERELALLARLERIDLLRREDAPAEMLLEEVRSLLSDAEEWVRDDPAAPTRAAEAIECARTALAARESRSKALLATP
jgi:hypothetical protein